MIILMSRLKLERLFNLKNSDLSGCERIFKDYKDENPLHCDEEYAKKKTKFRRIIVHGLHTASLFSTLLGMVCPGKRALCLTQTLNYKDVIYPNLEKQVGE